MWKVSQIIVIWLLYDNDLLGTVTQKGPARMGDGIGEV